MAGQFPTAFNYEKHFPHFAKDIDKVVVSTVISIANGSMPVEECFGDLPRQIHGYDVLHNVGRDWVSVHYDAIQSSLQRKVRLRVLLFPTEDTLSRASLVAKLEHPNCESIVDVFQTDSAFVIASQLETGSSIAEIMVERLDSITSRQIVQWIRGAAEALLEMHRRDIAHLSVSPSKILSRFNGEAVLINPLFEQPLERVDGVLSDDLCQQLPFPYRSIRKATDSSIDHVREDTIALGLVLFQLLTKLPLENFYLNPPLPEESMRLKKLIADQLNYSSSIDPTLKALCLRSTLGVINDFAPCSLLELRNELHDWERRFDVLQCRKSEANDSHSPKGSRRKSVTRGFPWFSG
ncbi:serine/threonine-protein kinase [Mariniblastus fucicola]|nr:hypothetical protein [Mariniblastus fucicola]